MRAKTARIIFLILCLALSILLILNTITPVRSGLIFAAGLVLLGVLSKGFRRN